jgi:hypothetical protein
MVPGIVARTRKIAEVNREKMKQSTILRIDGN